MTLCPRTGQKGDGRVTGGREHLRGPGDSGTCPNLMKNADHKSGQLH